MALDEAISESVRKKLTPITFRLYQWSDPSVSIGYFQKISDINTNYCKEKGYKIVRRATGGTAIFHDSDLTYSFSARNDIKPFKDSLLKNYMLLGNALANALKLVKLDADIARSKNTRFRSPFCFKTSSYGEITVKGRKVIGSAQKRHGNGFLQQGTFLMDFDINVMNRILHGQNSEDYFSSIGSIRKFSPSIKTAELKAALKTSFENVFNIQLKSEEPTDKEIKLAGKLIKEKYSTKEWNFRR